MTETENLTDQIAISSQEGERPSITYNVPPLQWTAGVDPYREINALDDNDGWGYVSRATNSIDLRQRIAEEMRQSAIMYQNPLDPPQTFNYTDRISNSGYQIWQNEVNDVWIQDPSSQIPPQGILEDARNLIEERAMEEEILVEEKKVRKTRKPKVLPPFSIEKSEGEKTEYEIGNLISASPEQGSSNSFLLCPYTNYIPIDYLLANTAQLYLKSYNNNYNAGKLKKLGDFDDIGFILGFFCYQAVSSNNINTITRQALKDIDDFILHDKVHSTENLYNQWGRNTFEGMRHSFKTSNLCRYYTRTYSGRIGCLTIYNDCYNGSKYTPESILVTLPENYLYLKYHLLMTGKIDLSKCFLLVNKELDSTSYPNKNFRAFFNKYLAPVIKEHKLDIFKVPREFMEENCFVGKYQLESKNIFRRKEEISELVKTFIQYGFNA